MTTLYRLKSSIGLI